MLSHAERLDCEAPEEANWPCPSHCHCPDHIALEAHTNVPFIVNAGELSPRGKALGRQVPKSARVQTLGTCRPFIDDAVA